LGNNKLDIFDRAEFENNVVIEEVKRRIL